MLSSCQKKEGKGNIRYYRRRRDNKTESLKSDLTDGDSSKWKEEGQGYNGDI